MILPAVTSSLRKNKRANPPPSSLLSDWIARSTGSGVIRSSLFESDSSVDNFRFTNGVGHDPNPTEGSKGTFVRRDPTGGIMGNGCLELEQMTDDNMNSYWQIPFDTSLTTWSSATTGYKTAHQPFYVQVAVKTNCFGVQGGVGGGGRKFWSVSSMQNSYTFQEQVFEDTLYKGVFAMYQGKGNTSTFQPYKEPAGAFDFNEQPGSEYAESPGFCSYSAINEDDRSNCWIPGNTWEWHLLYVDPATDQTADGTITVWVWKPGMSDYVRIIHKTDFYMEYDSDKTKGFNAFIAWIYETGRSSGDANLKQWYDQVILSTEFIPRPLVG